MKRVVRWITWMPAAFAAFAAVCMLAVPLRSLLLLLCPASDLAWEGTTDDSTEPFTAHYVQTCYAAWFPVAETGLLLGMVVAATAAAACVAAWIAPARKRLCAALAFCGMWSVVGGHLFL